MKLFKQSQLTLSPKPERKPTESQTRADSKALRQWKKGKRLDLVVTLTKTGEPVTYGQVDWSSLERTGGPSGVAKVRGRAVRLSLAGDVALGLVCELITAKTGHPVEDSEAVRIALEAYARANPPSV